MRFETKAKLGYVLLTILLAVGMAYSVRRLSTDAEGQVQRLRTEELEITLVERIRWNGELVASSGRGYLISGDPELLAEVARARASFDENVGVLRTRKLGATGARLVAEVAEAVGEYMQVQQALLDARRQGVETTVLVRRFDTELAPLSSKVDRALGRLLEHKEAQLLGHYAEASEDRTQLELGLYALLLVLVLTGGGIAWYFARLLGNSYRKQRDALETARKALAARDEVMAMVAHDLRNPLGSIAMRAALLRQLSESEQTRQNADMIENVAMRMEYLIKTMLDVSLIEADEFRLSRVPCEVAELLDEANDLFEPLAAAKQIRLDRKLPDEKLVIDADHERVMQVFSNLLGNALKFTPRGGHVTITVDRDGNAARFAVVDSGPGISREHLPHIFGRFWKSEAPGVKSTGLGLFIARGIVEAHGGRIWAESEPGHGARFYFTVPLAIRPRLPTATSLGMR